MTQWIKFWALALIWGSSFLLIKVAVQDLGAFPLVSIRLGGAALLFAIYLYMTKRAFPLNPSERNALIFVGLFNTAVPFVLISWGETSIDSGLATVLNSTVPLFGLIIAHFTLSDEILDSFKIIGLIIGFVGVVVVTSTNIGADTGSFLGQLAVLAASMSYAVCIVSIRKFLRNVDPFTVAGYSIVIGAIAIIVATFIVDNPFNNDATLRSVAAGITLAVINTFVAYFLFYDLIANWGARATLVTYAMPPIGVTLGFVFLDENIGWQLIVGGIMIVSGILLARTSPKPKIIETPVPITEGVD